MDVAFVSNVVYPFVPGGAQKRVHEVGRRLADRGHAVTVYGRHQWDGPPRTRHEGMALRAVAPERDLYAGDRRSIREALGFAARLVAPLRRRVREHDVVVVSVFPYFPVLSSTVSALGTAVPLVTTWHEVWRDYWHDYLGRLGLAGRVVERLVAAVPQHPVAVSPTTARRLAELGVAEDEIAVVPNGVDVDRVRSVAPAADGHDVLFAGRLAPDKNVDLLVRAFDRLDAAGTLGIVGAGPARAGVERAVAAADRADDIAVLGPLDRHEAVLAAMRAADVFVSPSSREGFGLAALEARAAGCRVIAVDHSMSAVTDLLGPDDVAVEPTERALADGLERALASEPPGPAASDLAAYDWERVTDEAAAVYRRAADGR
jgi:glycosyltransferase involved in cell wall biosynthesis